MVKYIIFLLALFYMTSLFSQDDNRTQLFQLDCKGKAFELILTDINTFIAGKSNGFVYPVSKVVISSYEDNSIEFEIEGVDNSWHDLFEVSETPYGFVIIDNRLFVISSRNTSETFLNSLFEVTSDYKNFTTQTISPPCTSKSPKWFFEFKDQKYIWLGGEDLDALQ